jgi:hypothetical protein
LPPSFSSGSICKGDAAEPSTFTTASPIAAASCGVGGEPVVECCGGGCGARHRRANSCSWLHATGLTPGSCWTQSATAPPPWNYVSTSLFPAKELLLFLLDPFDIYWSTQAHTRTQSYFS